jgi:hypothetical protein
VNLIDFSVFAWGVFFPNSIVAENNTPTYKAENNVPSYAAEAA